MLTNLILIGEDSDRYKTQTEMNINTWSPSGAITPLYVKSYEQWMDKTTDEDTTSFGDYKGKGTIDTFWGLKEAKAYDSAEGTTTTTTNVIEGYIPYEIVMKSTDSDDG